MKPYIFILLLSSFLGSYATDKTNFKNYDFKLSELIDSLRLDPSSISIFIDKSDYKLSVVAGTQLVKEYPIALGGNPLDDKLVQGDQCTPEGEFRIVSKYPHKSWEKFIWIDYPNQESWRKHKAAKQNGTISKNAKIGGEIGIHGVPDDMNALIDIRQNWTLGCISLKNDDVNEIYPYINKETKITIKK